MMEDPNMANRQPNTSGDSYSTAPSLVQDGVEKASDAAALAKNAAGEAAGQAKDQASSLLGQAKDKALAAASDQKDGLADTLDDLAQSVHKSGAQFAGQQDRLHGDHLMRVFRHTATAGRPVRIERFHFVAYANCLSPGRRASRNTRSHFVRFSTFNIER